LETTSRNVSMACLSKIIQSIEVLEGIVEFIYFQSVWTQVDNLNIIDTDILTIRELAEYLKIAEKTAYRFASEGKVPGFKVGSAWRFRKSEIDRWITDQEQQKEVGS